jgi:hypothetical protein
VKHGPLLRFGLVLACVTGVIPGPTRVSAQGVSKPSAGGLVGEIRDASGVPQLGATVEIFSETPGSTLTRQFLTNTKGLFRSGTLAPGAYTVRVTLAGFLPTLEKHVNVASNLTTVLKIQLESMFASLDELRRPPVGGVTEPDEWKWVLRSAAGMRPILQWTDPEDGQTTTAIVMDNPNPRPRARLEMTNGARRPGSVSNVGAAPGTSFAYDQRIDRSNRIVFAGQVTYGEDAPAGGLAATWLPTGSTETGPASTIVLREAKLGSTGLIFRGARLDQGATIALGERSLLRVGGEFVLVGVRASAWNLRPRMKFESRITTNWYLDAVYAALPVGTATGDSLAADLTGAPQPNALKTALEQLDEFPALLWRKGRPVLEDGRHEEIAAERKFGSRSVLQLAAFHDDNSHVALFGRGNDLPSAEYFQDFYTGGFAYDGGSSHSWGSRIALHEKIREDLELTTIYAFSGALVPSAELDGPLRELLQTRPTHSLAAKIATRVPKTGTKLTASYKWISDAALSRVDAYGESVYGLSPYLQVAVRQPLPRFALGRWEANAECDNMLAQGYVPMTIREGQALLVPAFRSFRGGVSVQF